MKFTEMPYVRPDMERVLADFDSIAARFDSAGNAEEQIAAYEAADALKKRFMTAAALASVRHTIDTRDEFYAAENNFMDENAPVVQEKIQNILEKMLSSVFRRELEAHFGELFFHNLEIAARTFKPGNHWTYAGGKYARFRISGALCLDDGEIRRENPADHKAFPV